MWSAPGAPKIAAVLGFDPDEGVITFVDQRGVPGRIDLRLGDVSQAGASFKLAGAGSADGSSIFGVSGGKAIRFTATGRWELERKSPLAVVFPQPDGALVTLSRDTDGSVDLWRVFPPDSDILDSATVEGLVDGPRIQGGDLLYLATPTGFAVVQARNLERLPEITLTGRPKAAVSTPSGDRLFIAVEGDTALAVYDRYRGTLGAAAPLPATPRDLRMDPLGRYLLVRPEVGDSAWIIAVGTSKPVGTVRTAWRSDIPFVASDGVIATVVGKDVVFVDGATMRRTRRIAGGAADFWYPFHWAGFRPRAAGLDQPVEFEVGTSDTAADSSLAAAAAAADTIAPPADTAAEAVATPATTRWVVSFAALLVESSARQLAQEITVNGQHARLETTMRDGVPVHRVVLGPYSSRDEAERVGRDSGRSYWVYAAAKP
ncbi:MAG TPA: SPOR domain-containing protein [Gemmatimonadaceae bacterium]|nr:SPOR domain-containing protein [Gemmatimonadaceae bacterium]